MRTWKLGNVRTWAMILMLVALVGCESDLGPRDLLDLEAAFMQTWANDPTLINAINAQNSQNLSLTEIQRRDAEWRAGRELALVQSTISGACADRLRTLALNGGTQFREVFIMDNKGALVCASERTSDYWQGDEDKWLRTFHTGAVFIDEPAFDESAGEVLTQVSLPVKSGSTTIGVITAGISLRELR